MREGARSGLRAMMLVRSPCRDWSPTSGCRWWFRARGLIEFEDLTSTVSPRSSDQEWRDPSEGPTSPSLLQLSRPLFVCFAFNVPTAFVPLTGRLEYCLRLLSLYTRELPHGPRCCASSLSSLLCPTPTPRPNMSLSMIDAQRTSRLDLDETTPCIPANTF